MTTAKEVKALVAPLLARHSEMALVGRTIIIRPVHHLLCLITVDRTGEASRFRPFWGVAEVFAKTDYMPLGHGDRIYGGPPLWEWSIPDLPLVFADVVERVALPKLFEIETLDDYLAMVMPTEADQQGHVLSYIRRLFALGDLDRARDVLASDDRAAKWFVDLERLGIKDTLMSLGNRLGPTDRAKLAGLLHEWEAYTVQKLKIAYLWERTPFPVEETA